MSLLEVLALRRRLRCKKTARETTMPAAATEAMAAAISFEEAVFDLEDSGRLMEEMLAGKEANEEGEGGGGEG